MKLERHLSGKFCVVARKASNASKEETLRQKPTEIFMTGHYIFTEMFGFSFCRWKKNTKMIAGNDCLEND